jgi:hypothetical protein
VKPLALAIDVAPVADFIPSPKKDGSETKEENGKKEKKSTPQASRKFFGMKLKIGNSPLKNET